ncbi:MAG: polysaccharide lyase family 7 protein [Pseudonocardia sp.]
MPVVGHHRTEGRTAGRAGRRRPPAGGEFGVAELLARVQRETASAGRLTVPVQRSRPPRDSRGVEPSTVRMPALTAAPSPRDPGMVGPIGVAVSRAASAGPADEVGAAGPLRGEHRALTERQQVVGRWLAGAFSAATALAVIGSVAGERAIVGDPDLAGAATAGAAPPLPAIAPPAPDPLVALPAEAPEEQKDDTERPARAECAGRPGQVLDLVNWKLTLPTGSSSSPAEVEGQRLRSFSSADWFNVRKDCAVAFRAPVNGVTTSGSKNPRSELREMSRGGTDKASWSSTSGTHTMVVKEAFTKLPTGKPHLVGAQIHDAEDDVTVFRLEGSKLWVTNGDETHHALATSNYVLGTPFEAKFVVSGGQTRAYYNGRLVTTITKDYTGAYFKAGAYTQANCENAAPCDSGNYGETLVYDLKVTHKP